MEIKPNSSTVVMVRYSWDWNMPSDMIVLAINKSWFDSSLLTKQNHTPSQVSEHTVKMEEERLFVEVVEADLLVDGIS